MKEFIRELFEQDIHVTCEDGNLRLSHNGNLTDDIKQRIRDNKEAILAFFNQKSVQDRYAQIESIPVQDSYPLSSAQYRLWILNKIQGFSPAYNMPSQLELTESYDVSLLEKAIGKVIERHEILRTIFKENNEGEACQIIIPKEDVNFKIAYKDYSDVENSKDAAQDYIDKDAFIPFNLEKGPLLRVTLVKLSENKSILYYNMHHIISDGWSIDILMKDLLTFYNLYKNGSEPTLPELRIQYKDYAAWQIAKLENNELDGDKAYWSEKLAGELPQINLPSQKTRPATRTYSGVSLGSSIPSELKKEAIALFKKNGGSLFMGLVSICKILFYKYTNERDIVVGSPIAGRDHKELEDQIGFYVNTLVLRNQIEEEENFLQYFTKVKDGIIEDFNHQSYPFDRLVQDLNVKNDDSRTPVFDVMINLLNTKDSKGVAFDETKTNEILDFGNVLSKFDLSLTFCEAGTGLYFDIIYNEDVYEREMISQFMIHFKQLLEAIVQQPTTKIKDIDYLSSAEKEKFQNDFKGKTLSYDTNENVISLFQKQASKTPDAIAVVYNNNTYTYKELDVLSNQFASYLKTVHTIENGDLVGISIPRNEWLLISILGIFKTGAAYVPMDINYPEERIQYIEKDSACKVMVTSEIITDFKDKKDHLETIDAASITPNSVAYVIYTSGSTGVPKGVVLTHANLTSFLNWSMSEFKNTDFDILYAATSHCFDLSVFEMCYPLCVGKAIRVLENGLVIPEYINEDQKIFINTVPSVVSNLLKTNVSFENVVALNMAGEPIPIALSNALLNYTMEIRNLYGPSEDTTYSSCYKITDTHTHALPIGKPVANTTFYILSDSLQMQPIGVVGELCISGEGLATKYLNQDELTQEKFIPNPFEAGKLMYRTGDLGYWMPDGNIGFKGRKDHQIKIRGYRVELGEIEHILEEETTIEHAVVLIKDQAGEKVLVAYLQGKGINIEQVWDKLSQKLPSYMLPTHYCSLEKMLLLPNGKVAKKELLNLETQPVKSSEYVAPTNALEHEIAKIWEELFETKNIGINDNFFELGGNSLSLLGLVNKLHKTFHCKIEIQKIYAHKTIAKQAALIKQHEKSTYTEIQKVDEKENYTVSLMQERLLLLSNMDGSSTAYNMPTFIILNELVMIDDFKKAVRAVIERHEILRTTFKQDKEGVFKQWVHDNKTFKLEISVHDYREFSNANEKAISYINECNQTIFDLKNGPLISASLLRIAEDAYIFYYNMHHIISDGISMDILAKDTMAFYNAYINNAKPSLAPLKIQYKDYAEWQRNRFENGDFDKSKYYWLNQFSEGIPQLNLNFSAERPRVKTYNGSTVQVKIKGETFTKLIDLTKETNTTTFMNLMYVYGIVLNKYSNQEEFVIGSPTSVRIQEELSDQIGFYTNTLVYKLQLKKEENYKNVVADFKNHVLANFEHREYPFDLLVDNLGQGKDFSRNPLFDAMLVVNDKTTVDSSNIEANTSIAYKEEKVRSKFDLTLTFEVYENELNCNVIFNTDLYNRSDIENMMNDYMEVLQLIVNDPSLTVSEYADAIQDEADLQEHDSFLNDMMKMMESDL